MDVIIDSILMLLLSVKVSGSSYILWAAENYQDCCKIADEIAAKEAEEENEITLNKSIETFHFFFIKIWSK